MSDPIKLDSDALVNLLSAAEHAATNVHTLPMTIADVPDAGGEPEVLDNDNELDESVAIETIEVWNASCFRCDTFNPSAKAPLHGPDFGCHFSEGNPMCPGARYQVVVLGPKVKALQHLRKVIAEHGPTSMTYVKQLGETLGKLPTDADREFVMKSLQR